MPLLHAHRSRQATVKMRHRDVYRDYGLVFGRAPSMGRRKAEVYGAPLSMNNINQREFAAAITAAQVKRITIHGLRHTCATLLLSASTPLAVVSERLGHKDPSITLDTYAHVLPI